MFVISDLLKTSAFACLEPRLRNFLKAAADCFVMPVTSRWTCDAGKKTCHHDIIPGATFAEHK